MAEPRNASDEELHCPLDLLEAHEAQAFAAAVDAEQEESDDGE